MDEEEEKSVKRNVIFFQKCGELTPGVGVKNSFFLSSSSRGYN